jgi:hypothetical protein
MLNSDMLLNENNDLEEVRSMPFNLKVITLYTYKDKFVL